VKSSRQEIDALKQIKEKNAQRMEHQQSGTDKELQSKMKQIVGTDEKYSPYADRFLWKSAREMALYFMVFVWSGFTVKYFLDHVLAPETSEIGNKDFDKKMRFDVNSIGEGIYKNHNQIDAEFAQLKTLTPSMIKSKHFFTRNKSFFVQIEPDEEYLTTDESRKWASAMHPHYYWLRKAVR